MRTRSFLRQPLKVNFFSVIWADKEFGNGTLSDDVRMYREVLTLAMEHLWTQKIHIDEIKNHCDWMQRNEIELKKLPQILFHASKFLDEEAKNLEQKLMDVDLKNGEFDHDDTRFDARAYPTVQR